MIKKFTKSNIAGQCPTSLKSIFSWQTNIRDFKGNQQPDIKNVSTRLKAPIVIVKELSK